MVHVELDLHDIVLSSYMYFFFYFFLFSGMKVQCGRWPGRIQSLEAS